MMDFTNKTTNESLADWQAAYSFWVNGILTLILVIVGVGGNVAMIVSLARTRHWIPLYYYFMTFSLWNTTLLASTVFFYSLPSLDDRIGASADFTYLNVVGYPLANAGMTASVWLVLSVTVERCIVVSRPLDQMVSEPKRRAKFVTAAISILAPLYNLPLFFELRVVNDGVDLAKSELRDDPAYKIGYRIVGNTLCLSLVPFLSIIAMSIRIICVVQNAMASSHSRTNTPRRRLRSSRSVMQRPSKTSGENEAALSDRERLVSVGSLRSPLSRVHSASAQKNAYATHLTLAALATKFVLCYTLPTVLNILEIIVEPSTLQQEGLGFLVDVSNLMVVADSAFNAFVYTSWRRKIQIRHTKSIKRKSTSATGQHKNSRASIKSRNESVTNGKAGEYTRMGLPSQKSPDTAVVNGKMTECAL